ncbi:MAG: flagellin, partial [Campylobacterales bacterium]
MSPNEKGNPGEKVFSKESDTLRSFLGDDNDITTDDPPEFFYISGTNTNGVGFTEKFSLNPDYIDESNATTVRDMLDRVGVAFGNTTTNKVVDVSMNEWGQIEVKDLTEGSSKINFHMVSSKADVNDTDALIASGERITEYVKSNYYSLPTSTDAQSVMEDSDHRIHEIPTVLKRDDNSIARPTDTILDVFGVDGPDLELSGTAVSPDGTAPGGAVGPVTPLGAGATVDDLLTQIKQNYSTVGAPNYDDIDVELTNGRIIITDKTVLQTRTDIQNPPYDGMSSLDVQIASNSGTDIFANDFSAEVDKVRFQKSGSYLNANTSQVIAHNNEYATAKTKLIEVSSPQRVDGSYEYSLDGKTINMDLVDVNGTPYHIDVNLANGGSTYGLTNTDTGVNYGPYQLFENFDSTTSTPADEVTYEQLSNVMEIGLNFSNLVASGTTPSPGNAPANVNDYRDAMQASQEMVDVSLDYKGRFEVYDKTQNESEIELAMYDDENTDFTAGSADFARLSFHENNALTIDDPHVDFFTSVDAAIDAVKNKIYRPDGYNEEKDYDADPRSIGIQNSIAVFDHLMDHVNKIHAKNGSQGNALQHSFERNEIMIVQAKTLKSDIADTDMAEASMQLSQLQLNYQAMLSSIGKINQLSLVNYI